MHMKWLTHLFTAWTGRNIFISTCVVLLLSGAAYLIEYSDTFAQVRHHGMGQHYMGRDSMGEHHSAGGAGHDMENMPGLRGRDATADESAELAAMFRNFSDISRTVTKLPNGIRTITYSANEELMAIITSHVVGMISRVEEGRDPKIFIQSPTLDIIFERADRIKTEVDTTDEGIVVVQTSDDMEVVEALHTHADEVTDMADRGMEAVHEAMMERHHN